MKVTQSALVCLAIAAGGASSFSVSSPAAPTGGISAAARGGTGLFSTVAPEVGVVNGPPAEQDEVYGTVVGDTKGEVCLLFTA